MKNIILILVLSLLPGQAILACSVIKYTINGKTYVGNNEDWVDPNTWMWTEPASRGKHGAVYFGFENFFAQGGINDQGLVFDGFATPALDVLNTKGKKKMGVSQLAKTVMQSFSRVEEVKAFLEQYDLSDLKNAQLMYIDRFGNSIIVEGDEILYSSEKYRIATNFYQSLVPKAEYPKSCDRYATADAMLSQFDNFTVQDAAEVMSAVSQTGPGIPATHTQYTNIYDTENGIIYLYLFRNFEEVTELSVAELLGQEKMKKPLHTMFKNNDTYMQYKENYDRHVAKQK